MWTKIKIWLLILIPFLLMVLLFTQKSRLEQYVSRQIKTQAEINTTTFATKIIDSLYNYQLNEENYQFTFLEFGAKGCVACRKMEFVMDDVREAYPNTVKVVFLNILHSENQALMKHYGVVSIPTQILLNTRGTEYYRHTGFISFEDLRKHF